MREALPKLTRLDDVGEAARFVLSDCDGAEHEIVVTNEESVGAGSLANALRPKIRAVLDAPATLFLVAEVNDIER